MTKRVMHLINTIASINLLKIHAFLFVFFTIIYMSMDFEKHFNSKQKNAIYFSASVHSGVGFGDISPITDDAKILVALHAMCSFGSTLLVISRSRR